MKQEILKKEKSIPSQLDNYPELTDRQMLSGAVIEEINQSKSKAFFLKIVFWAAFGWVNIFLISFFVALISGKTDIAQALGLGSSAPILALVGRLVYSWLAPNKVPEKSLMEKTQVLITEKKAIKKKDGKE